MMVVIAMSACAPDQFAGLSMGPRKPKLRERILAKQLSNGLQVVLMPGQKRIAWYKSIGSPVGARVDERATKFQISSLSTFGDWHVWYLAWTVLHGAYPRWLNQNALDRPEPPKPPPREVPSALSVVRRRLAGTPRADCRRTSSRRSGAVPIGRRCRR